VFYGFSNHLGDFLQEPFLERKLKSIREFFSLNAQGYLEKLTEYIERYNMSSMQKFLEENDITHRLFREAAEKIGGYINLLVEPTESCGYSANDTAFLFLGLESKNLIYTKDMHAQFNKIAADLEENTILGEILSYPRPALVRIEIALKNSVTGKERGTHSYCMMVEVKEIKNENEYGAYTYQAYISAYTLAEWFNSSKSKSEPLDFQKYLEDLSNLLSHDKALRTRTYAKLYRTSGTENDQALINNEIVVRYATAQIDTRAACANIQNRLTALQDIIQLLKDEHMDTLKDYFVNACWKNIGSYVTSENLEIIKQLVSHATKLNDVQSYRI
jgi:hypothetical protein